MLTSKQSKIYLIIVSLILLALAGYLWAYQSGNDKNNNSETTVNTDANKSGNDQKIIVSQSNSQSAQNLTSSKFLNTKTYTELVKEYEGRRIQFDEYCTAIPNNVTYRGQSKVMLDNRSNDQRKITVDGTVYNISPFNYKLITLPSAGSTNKTIKINCAELVNVATILIQQ